MPRKGEGYNTYMRQYMLRRYHRRRAEAVMILGSECARCGGTKNLELDHTDRKKKSFNLAKALTSWSEKRVQKELKKCQLLCRSCHQAKSLQERGLQNAKTIHGTLSSYRYCRCELCKAAKSEYSRQKRQKMGS